MSILFNEYGTPIDNRIEGIAKQIRNISSKFFETLIAEGAELHEIRALSSLFSQDVYMAASAVIVAENSRKRTEKNREKL